MYGGTKTKQCDKCNRKITNNNFDRHYPSCKGPKHKKIRGIDFDPNWKIKAGLIEIWNKGRRTKPDTRDPRYIGKMGGYRENAGHSKKFRVQDSFGNDVVLQSSYELQCSQILNNLNIKWIRPKSLSYDDRKYFADFYLTEHQIYLDPKNDYKAKQDAVKIRKVVEQNDVVVHILTKDQITEEHIRMLVSPNGEGFG